MNCRWLKTWRPKIGGGFRMVGQSLDTADRRGKPALITRFKGSHGRRALLIRSGRALLAAMVVGAIDAAPAHGREPVLRVSGYVQAPAADTLVMRLPGWRPGQVLEHIDAGWADTLVIRLFGIVSVQADQMCGRGRDRWPCGRRAREWLAFKLDGALVHCTVGGDAAGGGRVVEALFPPGFGKGGSGSEDGPGRAAKAVLARCAGGEIGDLGLALVEAGFAVVGWHGYRMAFEEARAEGRGIWRRGPGEGVARPDEWLARRLLAAKAALEN